ncbi:NAD(P)H-hydrate dehydratase [Lactococcus fujiensis]|uniref:ADP-dependent (S)-NAD(P)H-hydrate dehydratase n=1 Tax=Lactococcus fujiensis JCM 16395 TaxID=1291764 RepID=A0A2A5RL10_9LACT|nr:NAD(P)H-hydrate dehydratase [Lactococcus fujiensis]PCR99865.1 ADP-dependent (S)-NAD(P)H-hydrate dehydratase [Lactococcus fujiensis JCM 16395]
MKVLSNEILTAVIKKRQTNSHKGDYGRLILIGGDAHYGGAIILAASAAVYSGTGLTTVACDPLNWSPLHAHLPEAMVLDFKQNIDQSIVNADVIVIGPGLGLSTMSLQILKTVLKEINQNQILIIDGSAISLFAEEKLKLKFPENTIFTPHEMELQRLTGIKIGNQSVEKIQNYVNQNGVIIVAKSHETKVYGPLVEPFLLKVGSPAQATGGMGDTLAGMIGSFLGQFRQASLLECVAAATYLHSFIAENLSKDNYVVLPSLIISRIPKFMKLFEE